MKSRASITKGTSLGEVVRRYHLAAEIMLEYGLHCIGCFFNEFDRIEEAMKIHKLSKEDMDEMLERIRKALMGDRCIRDKISIVR